MCPVASPALPSQGVAPSSTVPSPSPAPSPQPACGTGRSEPLQHGHSPYRHSVGPSGKQDRGYSLGVATKTLPAETASWASAIGPRARRPPPAPARSKRERARGPDEGPPKVMEVTAPLATDRPPQVGECAGIPFLMTPMVQVPQGTTQPLVRRRALAPRFAGPTAAPRVREAERIDGGQARAVPNGLPAGRFPKASQVRLLDSEAQAEVPPPDRKHPPEAAGIVCTFTDRQRVGRVAKGPRRGSLGSAAARP